MARRMQGMLAGIATGIALALTAPAGAELSQPVTSTHHLTAGGKSLSIMAEVGTVPVGHQPGKPDATAGYIAYRLRAKAPKDRPVLFIFNGGPGSASSLLHMGAFGPMRVTVPQDPTAPVPDAGALVANDALLLDIADLVFIDPPGTGFSRIQDGADPAFYSSAAGDAEANAQLVRAWLVNNGRADAPAYLLGESYGTIRAAAMVDPLRQGQPAIRLKGVMLLGQALNMVETAQRPDNILSYTVSLPTLAAIACYHGKATPRACDPDRIADEAASFAKTDYLAALVQGRDLGEAEKARIADRLEALTGISADFYRAHDLRISKERFRVELLRAEGKVIGRYDARYTAPRPADAGPTVGPDAFTPVSNLYGKAIQTYLADRLKVPDAADYRVLVRPTGEWDYGGAPSPFTDWPFMAPVEAAMRDDPEFRLFVGTGLYDLTTTIGAADYLRAQSTGPADRMMFTRYAAGHVAYSDDASWRQFLADVRHFLTAPKDKP
ncbi:S10 family peptidase [Niveispirillum irakense]|uniref:S10 family peptidase n=1 Tax=Niveispirillum irakense TaxID=34011 RepID=UPI001AEBC197|nr:peptidase S10 [Niveispirillum irakense]